MTEPNAMVPLMAVAILGRFDALRQGYVRSAGTNGALLFKEAMMFQQIPAVATMERSLFHRTPMAAADALDLEERSWVGGDWGILRFAPVRTNESHLTTSADMSNCHLIITVRALLFLNFSGLKAAEENDECNSDNSTSFMNESATTTSSNPPTPTLTYGTTSQGFLSGGVVTPCKTLHIAGIDLLSTVEHNFLSRNKSDAISLSYSFDVNPSPTRKQRACILAVGNWFCGRSDRLRHLDLTPLSNVSSIGDWFLRECTTLKTIDLTPLKNITAIPAGFLYGCCSLSAIDLTPFQEVRSIGRWFLRECAEIRSINLRVMPLCAQMTHVEEGFLYGCKSLSAIDLSVFTNLQSCGSWFLRECAMLSRVDISPLRRIVAVPDGFMMDCSNLMRIDLTPLSNVATIGNSFLNGCEQLFAVNLSALQNVTQIGNAFMMKCTGVATIDLNGLRNVVRVGNSFMREMTSLIRIDLTPLSQLVDVPSSFLMGCTTLESANCVALTNVSTIGSFFFSNCENLSVLDLTTMRGVTWISDRVLFNTPNLRTLDISAFRNVTRVGAQLLGFGENGGASSPSFERLVFIGNLPADAPILLALPPNTKTAKDNDDGCVIQ